MKKRGIISATRARSSKPVRKVMSSVSRKYVGRRKA